jgi:hypothetical protein
MENEKGDKPKRNLTLTGVIAWVLGICSLLAGITYIASNILAGLLYILVAVILIPPVIRAVQNKLNFNLSRGLKIGIVLILFVIIGVNMSSPSTSSVPENNTSNTNTGKQEVKATPKEYVEVFSFSGNGAKKSEPFTIKGDRFKVAYNCSGSLCSASTYKVGSKLMSDLIMNTTDPVNDETILYGSGEYYIDASVIGNFSMTVYDYK